MDTRDLLTRSFDAVREDLDGRGVAWAEAWYRIKCSAGSDDVSLRYTHHQGGPVQAGKDPSFDACDLLTEARGSMKNSAGQPWNQALLTLHADGRQEAAFDHSVPPPEPNRQYAEIVVVARLGDCLRRNLTFYPWAEAWTEADGQLGVQIRFAERKGGSVEDSADDCNGMREWLALLRTIRSQAGQDNWIKLTIRVEQDSDRVDVHYESTGKSVTPPPLSPVAHRSID